METTRQLPTSFCSNRRVCRTVLSLVRLVSCLATAATISLLLLSESVSRVNATQYAIIRADDFVNDHTVPSQTVADSWLRFIQIVTNKQVVAGVGLIANSLASPTPEFIPFCQNLDASGQFEIWSHGYDHLSGATDPVTGIFSAEFYNTTFAYQSNQMAKALNIVKQKLGITMHTFGAPGNYNDANTSLVLAQNADIKVWLYPSGGLTVPTNVIGIPRSNLEWKGTTSRYLDLPRFISEYNSNAPVICFQMHPRSLPNSELDKLADAIDFLHSKGAVFIKPYDYYLLLRGGSVPGAPTSLSATLVSSNQINLNWTDASTNETQFRIERKVNGGSFAFLTNRPAIAGTGGSGNYSDTNLSAGTTYTYRVRADGTNVSSAWSSEVSTNTPGAIGGGGGGATNNLEAELLLATSSIGAGAISTFGETNASGGTNSLFTATNVNNFITYTVNVPVAGTYNLRVMLNKSSNRGKCNLYLDGSANVLGTEMDLYNASGYAYQEVDRGNVTFTNAGNHTFKFQVNGKNASATAYKLAFDYLNLRNTDTNVPTVSVSGPNNGTSISGAAVSVTASATDDVGVVGVQFKLDGENLAEEVTTAPYGVMWDTTTVPDGAYTLTAMARDAAGNTTTSLAVTVTVANDPDDHVPVGVPVITGAAVSNNNFILSFIADPNGQYEVQRTETLTPPTWLPVATNIFGTSDEIQVTDTNALDRPKTFYRVKGGM
jgi:hypothetical protein